MKRNRGLLTIAMLAVFLMACATAGTGREAESRAGPPSPSGDAPRTITVVGIGTVSLVPDVAEVNVGAEATADTVSEAKAEVDRQMIAIKAALSELGIDEKDIQTSHYSIHHEPEPMQVMREGPTGEGQSGYRVSNMLRVAVCDVEKAGDLLDAAVEAGANQVHGVSVTVSDQSKWQGQAREVAMADAEARAAELASLAGVELGAVQSVSEVIGAWPAAMAVAPERVMSGGIAPGELEMSTRLQATYAIQ